jgi:microcystin-dependent protein
MSYTSKYTGNEIDELLDKVKVSSGDTLVTNSPIGSIVPYIGVNAPENYLICDGRELNIDEYKELADHFKKEFGTINHYGGNGETTFAIPDLRNEFLRGYHGDKDEQLSGEVGIHQDATNFNMVGSSINEAKIYASYLNSRVGEEDYMPPYGADTLDKWKEGTYSSAGRYASVSGSNTFASNDDIHFSHYTSRPTNVAVLFCIKYKNSVATVDGDYATTEYVDDLVGDIEEILKGV